MSELREYPGIAEDLRSVLGGKVGLAVERLRMALIDRCVAYISVSTSWGQEDAQCVLPAGHHFPVANVHAHNPNFLPQLTCCSKSREDPIHVGADHRAPANVWLVP